jgi:hypothetical protein
MAVETATAVAVPSNAFMNWLPPGTFCEGSVILIAGTPNMSPIVTFSVLAPNNVALTFIVLVLTVALDKSVTKNLHII